MLPCTAASLCLEAAAAAAAAAAADRGRCASFKRCCDAALSVTAAADVVPRRLTNGGSDETSGSK